MWTHIIISLEGGERKSEGGEQGSRDGEPED